MTVDIPPDPAAIRAVVKLIRGQLQAIRTAIEQVQATCRHPDTENSPGETVWCRDCGKTMPRTLGKP